ncbi:hypothetical protein [Deinococcus actinosclerus]|uniref:SGNH hydrolase-type esterase domain-containing protein n=1 Tax=Deinococcus actinosclerus TaxID=1768108 RepID=A0ABN4K6A4_9DEIO|nr:hypothetical protein [Deinococcus actinosclerus]ALW89610.1 hypothetical protein AUC44_12475 [Deinococcus actinosclerus]
MTNLIGAPRVPTDPAQRPSITGTVRYTRSYAGGAVAGLGTGEYPIRYDWPASGDLLAGTWLLDTGTPPLSPIPLAAARFEQGDPAPEGVLIIAGTLRYPSGAAQAFEVRRLPVETSEGVLDLRVEIDPPAWTTPQQLTDLIGDVQTALADAQSATQDAQAALTAIPGQVAQGLAPVGAALGNLAETSAYLVAQTDLTGRVDTVAALPGGQAAGTQYLVAETGTVWRVQGGTWADTGYGVALRGAPQASSLHAQIITDAQAATPGAYRRTALRLATTTDTVTVLILLDSISEGADQIGYGLEDTYAGRLTRWLEQHFGNRVRVVNLALGQRRIEHFNDPNYKAQATEPANIDLGFGPRSAGDRPWAAANVGKSWQQIAQEQGADLVVLACGMNQDSDANGDQNFVQRAYLTNVLDTIGANWWTWQGLAPDVLIVTPMMPAANYPKTPHQMRGMGTMQRGVARARGLPVADVNRLSNVQMYGLDPETRTSRAWLTIGAGLVGWTDSGVASWARQSDGTYTRTGSGTGYMQRDAAQFMDGEIRAFAVFGSDTQILNVKVRIGWWGQINVQWTGHTVQVFESPSAGGAGRVLGGHSWAQTLAGGGTWAGAGQSIYLYAEGTRLRLTHNSTDVPLLDSALGLQPTTVQVGTDDPGYLLPDRLLGFEIIPRDPVQAAGVYNTAELLGPQGASGGPQSGNALNHPTGTGYAVMYHAVIVAALSGLPGRVAAAGNVGDAETTIAAPYAAGWSDLDGYVPAQISKRGSRVEMSGNTHKDAGAGTTVMTLPPGYRPPTSYLLRLNTNGGMLTATVQADGQIVTADPVPDGGWIAWSGAEWRTS